MPRADKYAPLPTGRPRGRPPRASRPIGPAELEKIEELRLRGQSVTAIARVLGVTPMAIEHHLRHTLEPKWRTSATNRTAWYEVAKVDHLECTAWERWSKSVQPETVLQVRRELESADGHNMRLVKKVVQHLAKQKVGEAVWLNVIEWCIEMRCKILGHFAAQRLDLNHSGELRVAGVSPEQLDATMADRLGRIVAENRRRVLEGIHNGAGTEN